MTEHRQHTYRTNLAALVGAVGLLLLAWHLFIHDLDQMSMWLDEEFSWRISHQGPEVILQETAQDVHPPLYYLWLWAWIEYTGSDNLTVMHFSSAITSLLAVAICYQLGKSWFRSWWAGAAAATFLASSGVFIFYARELRMHSTGVLMVALTWWMFSRVVEKRAPWWAYTLSLALAAYNFFFSGFMIVFQPLVAVLFYRDRLRDVARAWIGAGLLFLPWLPTFFDQVDTATRQCANKDQLCLIASAYTSPDLIERFLNLYTAGQTAFVGILIVIGILAGFTVRHQARYRRWTTAAVIWGLLVALVMLAIGYQIRLFNVRYALGILPGLALLIGVGIDNLPNHLVKAGAVVMIAVIGAYYFPQGYPQVKTPHQWMLRTIAERYQPGDRIWYNLHGGARGSSLELEVAYHLAHDAPNLNTDWFVWVAPNEFLDPLTAPRVWDVRPYWLPLPDFAADEMTDGRSITETYSFGAYTVRLYEAPPPDDPAHIAELSVLFYDNKQQTSRPGEQVRIKTWWAADAQPARDYSVGLYLFKGETPVTNVDAVLRLDGQPTSQWQPGEFAFAPLTFALPPNLPSGSYTLWMGVYYWEDPTLLPIKAGDEWTVRSDPPMIRIRQINVQ